MKNKHLFLLLILLFLSVLGSSCSGNGGGDNRGKRIPCPRNDLKVPCYLGPGGNLYQYEKMDKEGL